MIRRMMQWCSLIISGIIYLSVSSCNAQTPGCTDPVAWNFDPDATVNDGSCVYEPVSVSPLDTHVLSDEINETSGLIIWEGYVWTHNDNDDTNLYGLDTVNAEIVQTFALEGVENKDWEEIAQDGDYIYVGDFGNNWGNRQDLRILRTSKNGLLGNNQETDTIAFSYEDQTDFNPPGANETDFDCEAMVVGEDSIYLFTKQWISNETSVYRIPKLPGNHTAIKMGGYIVQGLITGATVLEGESLVVLCAYTPLLEPFLMLLYDFQGTNFFSGNKRKIILSLPFHQVEGIATLDGLEYYVSNEEFSLLVSNPQKLHKFDLSPYLEHYVKGGPGNSRGNIAADPTRVYPNPASGEILIVTTPTSGSTAYEIFNYLSGEVLTGLLRGELTRVDIDHLEPGLYIMKIGNVHREMIRFVKTQ